MACLRCEILRARFKAIVNANLGKTAEQCAEALTKDEQGHYFARRNSYGAMVYRSNNNPQAPDIEIWFFNEPEYKLNTVNKLFAIT